MKKIFMLLLCALMALCCMASCNGDTATESSADPVVVDVNALKDSIKGLTAATDTTVRSADDVYNDTGINPETYTEGFWLIDSTITVETVAFFNAKDEAAATEIKGFMDKYVKSVLNQQNNYNEDNYYMAEKAKVGVSGNYVYLIMSPNVDSIYSAVSSALKGE